MSKKPIAENTEVPEEERQPTRKGLAETPRKFDQTFLDAKDQTVHRDIAAHAGRWAFTARGPHPDVLPEPGPGDEYTARFFKYGLNKKPFIKHEKTDVLDVGCGPDRPLLLALFGGIGPNPLARTYTGVDMNKIKPTRHARSCLYPETNFIEAHERICEERGPFELITNFEVIEHMPKKEGKLLLKAFYDVITTDGHLILSTPVYDGKARAKNHIHEYTIPELQGMLEEAGFVVQRRYGTFANIHAIRKVCTPAERQLLDELGEYYGNDVLSTFLAPKYPDVSRNNLWVCTPKAGA
jgi:2-polyprenyl-3-methyl-5-hydroxy-6-metoxy-1,4-benzoquinol methylase